METDQITDALATAVQVYSDSRYKKRDDIRGRVESLALYSLFSATQISRIARVSTATVYKYLPKGYAPTLSGNLDPRTLDAMHQLRLNRLRKYDISYHLLERCVNSQTSYRVISKLTGIAQSTITRKLNEVYYSTDF